MNGYSMITKRRFIQYIKSGQPYKFWNCWVEGNTYFTEWGLAGDPATMKPRPCSSEAEAYQKMEELINYKIGGLIPRSLTRKYEEIDSIEIETREEEIQRRLRRNSKRKKRPRGGLLGERYQRNHLDRWLRKYGWSIREQE